MIATLRAPPNAAENALRCKTTVNLTGDDVAGPRRPDRSGATAPRAAWAPPAALAFYLLNARQRVRKRDEKGGNVRCC